MSPALADGFLTTVPPGKSYLFIFAAATCVNFVSYDSLGVCPFHLKFQICQHKAVYNIPY